MKRSPCLPAVLALAALGASPARAQQPPPPPAGSPNPAGPAAPAGPAGARDGAPRIHVEATEPATTLYKVSTRIVVHGRPSGVLAGPVCRAPCDQIVDGSAGQHFFFAGEGLTTSAQFQLPGKGADLRIDVLSGTSSRRTGGFVMAGLGAASLLGGLATLALGALATRIDNGQTVTTPSTPMMAAGGAVAGVGLGLVIGGIALVTRSKTTFSFPPPGTTAALLTF